MASQLGALHLIKRRIGHRPKFYNTPLLQLDVLGKKKEEEVRRDRRIGVKACLLKSVSRADRYAKLDKIILV